MNGGTGAGEPPETRVEIPGGQGVQVGDQGTQHNEYNIGTYIQNLIQPSPAPAPGQVVTGDVPQQPPAFQPRADVLAVLRAAGPGVSVVRAVTGMRGVGKTHIAAAYARDSSRSAGGWWRGSTPRMLAGCWRAWPRSRRSWAWDRWGGCGGGGPGGAAPAGDRRGAVPAGVRQRHRPGAAAAIHPRGRGGPGDHHQQSAVGGESGYGRTGGCVFRARGACVPGRANRLSG